MTTDSPMTLGMVGLGRMGANIARRLWPTGTRRWSTTSTRPPWRRWSAEGAIGADSLAELAANLPAPRAVWVMVPAGRITEATIAALAEVLEPGDTIIDGGNTHYTDDLRHAAALRREGHPPHRLRHQRRGVGRRARLLPDDRRRAGAGRAAHPDLRLAGPRRGSGPAHPRALRATRTRRNRASCTAARTGPGTS